MAGLRGKAPAKHDFRTLSLSDYINVSTAPTPPATADWTQGLKIIPMLLNNKYGCCVPAGKLHAIQRMTANSGTMYVPTDNDATVLYEQDGGFNPASPSTTDNGCVMLDAMNNWVNQGIKTSNGLIHKLQAYAQINLKDPYEQRLAIHLFGPSLYGVILPQSAETQFDANQPWIVVVNSPILGGHCIICCGYDGTYFYIDTWGRGLVPVADPFLVKYLDEAYAPLAINDWVKNNNAPSGVDLDHLLADLKIVQGASLSTRLH